MTLSTHTYEQRAAVRPIEADKATGKFPLVEAVQLTLENAREVAHWCGGEFVHSEADGAKFARETVFVLIPSIFEGYSLSVAGATSEWGDFIVRHPMPGYERDYFERVHPHEMGSDFRPLPDERKTDDDTK